MITKKHCTEFVEIISKIPCHQHVYKTIAEARRLVREPGPQHRNTNCNVLKSTKHVLLANELAKKHLFQGQVEIWLKLILFQKTKKIIITD